MARRLRPRSASPARRQHRCETREREVRIERKGLLEKMARLRVAATTLRRLSSEVVTQCRR